MSGFLRMLGVIAVVALGGIAILVVLGVLPPELLQQWGVKVAAVIGISLRRCPEKALSLMRLVNSK